MEFARRQPSTTWEPAPLPGFPSFVVWFWFRPPALPEGLAIQFSPDADWSTPGLERSLTMRTLLGLAGLDPAAVWGWGLHGHVYESQQGRCPYLDSPLPAPVAGVDPTIHVYVAPPQSQPQPVTAVPEGASAWAAFDAASAVDESGHRPGEGTAPASPEEALERMDVDWRAAREVEADVVRLRKQLDDQRGRVKALNRDFNSDERVHSSPADKKDWIAARRALHECELRLTQCIKESDIGYATKAGQREWFEQVYEAYVQYRRPFEGVEQAQRQFEVFRKIVTTLQTKMKTVGNIARQDGERRAETILKRVQAKIREAKTKKNMLGVMFD